MDACKICGSQCETPSMTICSTCSTLGLMRVVMSLAEYQQREMYDIRDGLMHATKIPPTGIRALDTHPVLARELCARY